MSKGWNVRIAANDISSQEILYEAVYEVGYNHEPDDHSNNSSSRQVDIWTMESTGKCSSYCVIEGSWQN